MDKNISKITFALEIDYGQFKELLNAQTSGVEIRKQEILEAEVPQEFTSDLANELHKNYKLHQN